MGRQRHEMNDTLNPALDQANRRSVEAHSVRLVGLTVDPPRECRPNET